MREDVPNDLRVFDEADDAHGLLVSGLEEISLNNLIEIDKSMKLLVRIFGAQTIPPKLILSAEVNVPNNSGVENSDKNKERRTN